MGKRQKRIFKPQIASYLSQLVNQPLQAIDQKGFTVAGVLVKFDQQSIVLKDAFAKKHIISLADITEFIIDQESQF
jgi:small nuclear ribonucleoprotein (snRNP)-like protein